MPNKARTHEDCRKTVCFLCMRKCDRELTDFMIALVLKLVKSDLKFEDERVPRGICNTCHILLEPGTRHRNLQSLVQDDIKGAEQIAVSVIENKETSPHGTVRLSQGTGGKLFPVRPGNI